MASINDTLDMIATEAFDEAPLEIDDREPVLQYDLELIRRPDGTLEWVE